MTIAGNLDLPDTYLPADPGAEVVHDDPVSGACGSAVLSNPWRPSVSTSCVVGNASGMLHRDPMAVQLGVVQLVDGVIGITMVIEFLEEAKKKREK